MRTCEQTAIYLRDAEISILRKENERLKQKLKDVRLGFSSLIRYAAKDMNYANRVKMLDMANELDAMD